MPMIDPASFVQYYPSFKACKEMLQVLSEFLSG